MPRNLADPNDHDHSLPRRVHADQDPPARNLARNAHHAHDLVPARNPDLVRDVARANMPPCLIARVRNCVKSSASLTRSKCLDFSIVL